jgi:hypothetical protein
MPPSMSADGRRRLLAFYDSVLPHFRRRRMRLLEESLRITSQTRVLDVGGTPLNWRLLEQRPRVTVLNLDAGDVVADGRRLPFRDRSFDLVFSNSTIEHVGSLVDQRAFATEVARVGQAYFVQTPNLYFPLEPHMLTPGVQFLPRRARLRVARNFTVWGWFVRPSPGTVRDRVGRIRLLGSREMRVLFPEARLHRERWCGITKSLIAIGGDGNVSA